MAVVLACGALALCASTPAAESALDKAMKEVATLPPAWLAEVKTDYDLAQPWSKARLEVRRLLAAGRDREAIRLTCIYLVERKAVPDDHEYAMYVFLGREFAWAAKIYEERLRAQPKSAPLDYLNLAGCYLHFRETARAVETLGRGLANLPAGPRSGQGAASLHERMGDAFLQSGDRDKAAAAYHKALDLYAAAGAAAARLAARTRAKVANIENPADPARLADGAYRGVGPGYVGAVKATVQIKDGRIAEVKVEHRENIMHQATDIVPKRIVEKQSPAVDAVSGATVTSQAIMAAVREALDQAPRR